MKLFFCIADKTLVFKGFVVTFNMSLIEFAAL